MVGLPSWSAEFCEGVQFDFTDPQKAYNLFQGCRGSGSHQNEQDLIQRFTSNWAQFAAQNGVASALRTLSNDDVRSVLLPPYEWGSLVTHFTGSSAIFSKISGNLSTLITLQVVTIISTIASLFMVFMFMLRQTTLMRTCNAIHSTPLSRKRTEECLPGEDIGLLNELDQMTRNEQDMKNQMNYNND